MQTLGDWKEEKRRIQLGKEEKETLEHVQRRRSGVVVVDGGAGTGKSSAAVEMLEPKKETEEMRGKSK